MEERTPFNQALVESLIRYIGTTVIIYTASGGESGLGFSGVLLSVNASFISLVTNIGLPPAPPIHPTKQNSSLYKPARPYIDSHMFGSITDIPIDCITSFVHNNVSYDQVDTPL